MGTPATGPHPAGAPGVSDAVQASARELQREADEITERIADYIQREVRDLPADPQTREELRQGAQRHVLDFLHRLQRGEPLDSIRPAPEALASARALARSGRSLEPVLRVCHYGHHVFLDAWNRRLAASGLPGDLLAEAVGVAQEHTFRWLDGLVRQLTGEYEREQAVAGRSLEAARMATVHAILVGEATDADAVSRAISYELRRHHLALVLWARARPGRPTALPELTEAADELAGALGSKRPLKVPAGGGLLWMWASTQRPLEPERVVGLREARAEGVSVAVGEPGFGLPGFRSSHQDAAEAARVALLAEGRIEPVVRYRSVEVLGLLTQDMDRARRFVRRHLEGLASEGEEYERLRGTLRVYLEEHGSRVAAAERLGVHPNTVSNRVVACGELLGADPLRGGADLELALRLAALLGSSVLEGAPEKGSGSGFAEL